MGKTMAKTTKKNATKNRKLPLGYGQFTTENQPVRRRTKGIITILKEAIGREYGLDLTANEILDISQFIMESNKAELDILSKDPNQAMLVQIPAKMLTGSKQYAVAMYDKILERALKREGFRISNDNTIQVEFFSKDEEDVDAVS